MLKSLIDYTFNFNRGLKRVSIFFSSHGISMTNKILKKNFDDLLETAWKKAESNGILNYKVEVRT